MGEYSSRDMLISIFSKQKIKWIDFGDLYTKILRRSSTFHLESKYCDKTSSRKLAFLLMWHIYANEVKLPKKQHLLIVGLCHLNMFKSSGIV